MSKFPIFPDELWQSKLEGALRLGRNDRGELVKFNLEFGVLANIGEVVDTSRYLSLVRILNAHRLTLKRINLNLCRFSTEAIHLFLENIKLYDSALESLYLSWLVPVNLMNLRAFSNHLKYNSKLIDLKVTYSNSSSSPESYDIQADIQADIEDKITDNWLVGFLGSIFPRVLIPIIQSFLVDINLVDINKAQSENDKVRVFLESIFPGVLVPIIQSFLDIELQPRGKTILEIVGYPSWQDLDDINFRHAQILKTICLRNPGRYAYLLIEGISWHSPSVLESIHILGQMEKIDLAVLEGFVDKLKDHTELLEVKIEEGVEELSEKEKLVYKNMRSELNYNRTRKVAEEACLILQEIVKEIFEASKNLEVVTVMLDYLLGEKPPLSSYRKKPLSFIKTHNNSFWRLRTLSEAVTYSQYLLP